MVYFRSNSIVHHGRMVVNVHNTYIPIGSDQNSMEIHVVSFEEEAIASLNVDHDNTVAYGVVDNVAVEDWHR